MQISESLVAKKKARIEFAEQRLLGDEPKFTHTPNDSELRTALNWYNYLYTGADARKWLYPYIKENYPADVLETLKRIPDYAVISTACFLCKMIANGTPLAQSNMDFLANAIERMISYKKPEEKKETPKVKSTISVYDRAVARAKRMLSEFEDLAFEAAHGHSQFSLYDWLTANEASRQLVDMVTEYINIALNEMADPQYFECNTAEHAKKIRTYYKKLSADVDRFANNKKVARKPRESKKVDTAKVVAGVKYMPRHDPLQLVSINPKEIIGAKELWIYNPKYRMLGVYKAATDQGLGINSTTLTNFDPEKSVYKTLRKPEISLAEFFKAGKVELRTFLQKLSTTEAKLASRLNESTVLLKANK